MTESWAPQRHRAARSAREGTCISEDYSSDRPFAKTDAPDSRGVGDTLHAAGMAGSPDKRSEGSIHAALPMYPRISGRHDRCFDPLHDQGWRTE